MEDNDTSGHIPCNIEYCEECIKSGTIYHPPVAKKGILTSADHFFLLRGITTDLMTADMHANFELLKTNEKFRDQFIDEQIAAFMRLYKYATRQFVKEVLDDHKIQSAVKSDRED